MAFNKKHIVFMWIIMILLIAALYVTEPGIDLSKLPKLWYIPLATLFIFLTVASVVILFILKK